MTVSNVNFYANNFQSASSKLNGLLGWNLSNNRFNIFQYYSLPLISFGYVITNPENASKVLKQPFSYKYRYNKEKGLIESDITDNKYAFLFLKDGNINYSVDHLNRSGYIQNWEWFEYKYDDYIDGVDNLSGNYYKVSLNDNNYINSADNSFDLDLVYFHGMFVDTKNILNTSGNLTANLNLSKFRNSNCTFGGDITNRSAIFEYSDYYGYSCWRLA